MDTTETTTTVTSPATIGKARRKAEKSADALAKAPTTPPKKKERHPLTVARDRAAAAFNGLSVSGKRRILDCIERERENPEAFDALMSYAIAIRADPTRGAREATMPRGTESIYRAVSAYANRGASGPEKASVLSALKGRFA